MSYSKPGRVIFSCETIEQLNVAWAYCELWLKRRGLGKSSPEARALFELFAAKGLRLLALQVVPGALEA
jgi:hypothetical protein